jgi:hypothetical protein
MSGFSVPPKPDPGTSSTAPWDFATFLQKTADQKMVSQGPGGATVVLDKDSLFAPPPSQQGLGDLGAKVGVKTNDPKLDEPMFAGLGLWSMQFATTIINILIGSMKGPSKSVEGLAGDESLATTLAYREEALYQALVEEGLISPEAEEAAPFSGIGSGVESEGVSETPLDVNDTNVNAAFFAWFQTLSSAVSAELPPLSEKTQALLQTIHSTDIGSITQTLTEMANLSSLGLTPTQQVLFATKLQVLATAIAGVNEEGGAFVLNMTVPGLMLPVLMETLDMSTDTTMSADDKGKLSLALLNICNGLSRANFEQSVSVKTPSAEFLSLVSADPQQVGLLLTTIISTMTLPPGVTTGDLIGAISSLTTTLCSLSPEEQQTLQSVDSDGLAAIITKGLDAAEASGAISSDVKAKLIVTLAPLLVDQITNINRIKLTGDLSSKDPATIEKSLTFLTGISSDKKMNGPTRRMAMNYIQALISALIYMSNIRCLMLQMETEFTQSLASAKVANITEELKMAELSYTTALRKVVTSYEETISALDQKHLWAWLGPLISVIIVLIMTVIIVILAVATVVSGGAAAPALVAAVGATATMVSAVVAAAVSIVIALIVIIDASCQWATGKTMWKMICESMGVTNELEIAAIAAAFEILIQLIAIICTFGAYSAVCVATTAAKKIVEVTIKEVLQRMVELLTKELAKQLAKKVVEVIITSLFSSGLLTQGMQAIAKASFKDEKKAAIFAMVMTIVVMLVAIVTMGAIGGGGGRAWKAAVPSAAAKAQGQRMFLAAARATATAAAPATGQATGSAALAAGRAVAGEASTIGKVAEQGAIAGSAAGTTVAAGVAAGTTAAAQGVSKISKMMKDFSETVDRMKDLIIRGIKNFFTSLKDGLLSPFQRNVARQAKVAKDVLGESIEETAQAGMQEAKQVVQVAAQEATQVAETAAKETKAVAQVGEALDRAEDAAKDLGVAMGQQMAGEARATEAVATSVEKVEKAGKEVAETVELAEDLGSAGKLGGAATPTVTFSLRNCLRAIGRGLLNFVKNVKDHYKELALGDVADTALEKIGKRLILATELMRIVQFALQLTVSIYQYEVAKKEEEYHKLLAVLAEDAATLQAMAQYFGSLAGIDQTETIQKITESSQEAFENWTRLLQVVSDFIKDAGTRISEMSSKAAM